MTGSIRLRLLAGTLAVVVTIWMVAIVFAWLETRREAGELFDAHLEQTASLLAATFDNDEDDFGVREPQHRYARNVAFQIWDDKGKLVTRSASAPMQPLAPAEAGFSDTPQWRVYSVRTADRRYLVHVAETYDARTEVSRDLAEHLLAPLAMALPLLVLALILLIRGTLAPLSTLAASIGQRSPQRLDAIPLAGAPFELHPILEQFNVLIARVQRSLEQERRFTGDAAHELRTPLAAMRAQAQVARASRDEAERMRALDNVVAAIDRTTHLTEQLLALARLDAADAAIARKPSDLRALAAEAVALAAPTAFGKHVEIELDTGPPVMAVVEPALIATLLRNLIDNAVRYSPPHRQVKVAVSQSGTDARIDVVDQGPGIAVDELARVRDRFYRIAGTGETGSGLGLSIVSRIVELHGGRLDLLTAGESGLRASVVLSAAG